MKTITRSNIYVSMTAMILTAALAVPAVAKQQVPFKGTIQGDDRDTFISETTVLVTTTGTGIGAHMGQFSFTLESTVDLTLGTDTGFAHFIAANGDSIYATIVGSGAPTDNPDIISIMETCTITGGTGRFEGAQGSFTVERQANGATFVTSGTFDGTITSPGAAH
ncbi:MAG: hypothetical protein JWQ49_2185 [Edaphobacter sp.]|nr:hypothetical protein [Edaphobacter sp.]